MGKGKMHGNGVNKVNVVAFPFIFSLLLTLFPPLSSSSLCEQNERVRKCVGDERSEPHEGNSERELVPFIHFVHLILGTDTHNHQAKCR